MAGAYAPKQKLDDSNWRTIVVVGWAQNNNKKKHTNTDARWCTVYQPQVCWLIRTILD